MGKTDEERAKKKADKDAEREAKHKERDEEKAKKDTDKGKSPKKKDEPDEHTGGPTVVFPVDTPVIQSMDTAQLVTLSDKEENDWKIFKIGHGREGNLHKVVDFDGYKSVLQVLYPKGSINPGNKPVGGIGFYAHPSLVFPSPDFITLEYDLYFADDFDPVLAGKLPGIFIGSPGASGGRHSNNQASARLMWRTFANKYIKAEMEAENGKKITLVMPDKKAMEVIRDQEMKNGLIEAEVYCYNSDNQDESYSKLPGFIPNDTYGDSLWRGVIHFRKGQWNHVELTVKQNSFTNGKGNKDGVLIITLNGTEKQRFDKMVWTDLPANIEGLVLESFYGGSKPQYASSADTSIYFRDFKIIHDLSKFQ